MFKALLVSENPDKTFARAIVERDLASLPDNDVLVRVAYSSLNYKDALSASGNTGVTKTYPHTPGIDAAGVVEADRTGAFRAGEQVIVTSYDLGMNTSGGFGEYICVPAGWVVRLPEGLTLREAMQFGTAGLTAAIAVDQLQRNDVLPQNGDVLVTGASGGVGSYAVAILAKAGYRVIAATGKLEQATYLHALGAAEVMDRASALNPSSRPLLSAKYAGAVDAVGGATLASILKMMKIGGAVAALGNVGGAELNTTVFPFILRGVSLLGVDSGNLPMPRRAALWQKLADDWKPAMLERINQEVTLDGLNEQIDRILRGQIAGHVLVKI
ncbi:MAG TPA: YhdH/YhfP family quinone oxidoreductase [Thermoflexales bacterium]|nr:YhdH/YhfP family quinone oxidoreductase [Thermoflexales bacterium]HQW34224.1 YhdH/YhfP family quinone oxidoreductase [Thermoflexales bacterium]HQZ20669.1 YhdH/YhfP family quinone oxidoreductase [Thermoflexales bacterium]HQZ99195.1 YhdH/YhfP family quinone oxidoreductase [Thermoflexales bacterium]